MHFPIKVTCPKCSAALTVTEPAVRGRCKNCGTVLDLHTLLPPMSNLAATPSAAAVCRDGTAADNEPPTAADSGVKHTVGGPTGRGRNKLYFAAVATVGAVALITWLYYFHLRSEPSPPVATDPPKSTADVAVVIQPPLKATDVITATEPLRFDGNSFGQLDSLLMGACGFAGSWLTGAGAAANCNYVSSQVAGFRVQQNQIQAYRFTEISASPGIWNQPYFPLAVARGPISRGPTGFGYQKVRVPVLDGLPLRIANSKLEALGLVPEYSVPSADVEKDLVMACNPRSGRAVDFHAKVTIMAGTKVPDLKNLTMKEAAALVEKSGFTPDYDELIGKDFVVVDQRPAPDALQIRGQAVAFVSAVQMPSVEKLRIADAVELLGRENITYGWQERQRQAEDVVCSQSIAPNIMVIRGDKHFDLFNAARLELWAGFEVPRVEGQTLDDANVLLRQYGIPARIGRTIKVQVRQPIREQIGQRLLHGFGPGENILADVSAEGQRSRGLGPANGGPVTILAQLGGGRGGGGSSHYQEVAAGSEDRNEGPPIIKAQDPQGGEILCYEGRRKLTVMLEQPVVRVNYFRRVLVQQPIQNGQGFGGDGQPPQGGDGGGFF